MSLSAVTLSAMPQSSSVSHRAGMRRRQERSAAARQQGFHLCRHLQAAGSAQGEQHAAVDPDPVFAHRVQRGTDLGHRGVGEEADPSEVDAEDQGVVDGGQPGPAQEGAVASQRHDEVGVAGGVHLLAGTAPCSLPHVDVRAPHGMLRAPCADHVGCLQSFRPPAVHDETPRFTVDRACGAPVLFCGPGVRLAR